MHPGITGLRGVATAVNRQPAVGYYVWHEQESAYLPLSIDVLRVSAGSITEVTIFGPEQFRAPRPAGTPLRGRCPVIRLARTGLLAAGVSLEVEGGTLPPSGIAFVTGVFSLVGVSWPPRCAGGAAAPTSCSYASPSG